MPTAAEGYLSNCQTTTQPSTRCGTSALHHHVATGSGVTSHRNACQTSRPLAVVIRTGSTHRGRWHPVAAPEARCCTTGMTTQGSTDRCHRHPLAIDGGSGFPLVGRLEPTQRGHLCPDSRDVPQPPENRSTRNDHVRPSAPPARPCRSVALSPVAIGGASGLHARPSVSTVPSARQQ